MGEFRMGGGGNVAYEAICVKRWAYVRVETLKYRCVKMYKYEV